MELGRKIINNDYVRIWRKEIMTCFWDNNLPRRTEKKHQIQRIVANSTEIWFLCLLDASTDYYRNNEFSVTLALLFITISSTCLLTSTQNVLASSVSKVPVRNSSPYMSRFPWHVLRFDWCWHRTRDCTVNRGKSDLRVGVWSRMELETFWVPMTRQQRFTYGCM